MDSVDGLFLDYSARKLRQLGGRIVECLGRLNAEQVWARGSQSENAVGNLVFHLCGNARQWIVSGVGGQPDLRQRDAEFAARRGSDAAGLAELLRHTVDEAAGVIDGLTARRLTERITIQNYDVTVLEAIYHVVEHFAGHTGQIIFATKMLTGEDLGFYRHLKTTVEHSEQTP